MVKRLLDIVLVLLFMTAASAQTYKSKTMRLKITINGQTFHMKPNGDPLVSQIAAMCPMEMEFSRSGNHEYYSRLPKNTDDSKSQKTSDAHKNELMYFGGWNCLSILFEDVNVAPYQLVKLGDFEEDIASFLEQSTDTISIKIEVK
ncbi:MAG: hypothetical protein IJK42_00845 [Prevotella sp.]|nr:hypothetical protein [Prevotella sp.]